MLSTYRTLACHLYLSLSITLLGKRFSFLKEVEKDEQMGGMHTDGYSFALAKAGAMLIKNEMVFTGERERERGQKQIVSNQSNG